jgi:hypothetical protein
MRAYQSGQKVGWPFFSSSKSQRDFRLVVKKKWLSPLYPPSRGSKGLKGTSFYIFGDLWSFHPWQQQQLNKVKAKRELSCADARRALFTSPRIRVTVLNPRPFPTGCRPIFLTSALAIRWLNVFGHRAQTNGILDPMNQIDDPKELILAPQLWIVEIRKKKNYGSLWYVFFLRSVVDS